MCYTDLYVSMFLRDKMSLFSVLSEKQTANSELNTMSERSASFINLALCNHLSHSSDSSECLNTSLNDETSVSESSSSQLSRH